MARTRLHASQIDDLPKPRGRVDTGLTWRQKATARANAEGGSYYVLISVRGRSGRLLRHGALVPRGWRVVDRVRPDPERDTGADTRIDTLLASHAAGMLR